MRKFRIEEAPKPEKKYKINIPKSAFQFEVDPEKIPYDRHGLPGSILEIVCSQDEHKIDHACGGVQACSTCHIYVTKGLENTNEVSDREQDFIDKARNPKLNSRLACCCVPNGKEDIEIEIPVWNVNAVKEGKD